MRSPAVGLPSGLALGMVAVATLTAAPPDLKTLFTNQAAVHVTTGRLSRLELPPEILTACRADLSDLRVFDASGKEVAFLVETGLVPNEPATLERTHTLDVLDVERHRTERDGEPPAYRETYELAVPDEVSGSLVWDLAFDTRQARYVRAVTVGARAAGGGERTLIESGSIFRLPSPVGEKSRLALPRFTGDHLTVTLEGEDGAYLNPVMRLTHSRSLDPREKALVELNEISRREVDQRTVIELERPNGLVPDSLTLATTTASFHRPVEIWDEGPGGSDDVLGRKRLFRVPASATVEEVEIEVGAAAGDRLRVVIGNGDSPPLEGVSFSAVIQRPALVFTLAPADLGAPSGLLRFGGGRAFRARYDLDHLRSALDVPSQGARARLAGELHELPLARLGDIEANPDFDPAPILAFAMRAGAEIDARLYSHRRRVEARPSPEGLTRLKLRLDDLAHAQPGLNDLRIVDEESRQWAYLMAKDASRDVQALAVEGPESEDGSSEYGLALPTAPATLTQVVLETDVPFFDRAYDLVAVLEDQERTLARGRIARRIGDPRPVKIGFPAARADSLKLVVEDGNDAPLAFERVTAEFPVPNLYFAAPEGSYSLLLGNPDDGAPRYELAQIRSIVLAVRSGDAAVDELTDNPDYSASARFATESGMHQALLWGALLLAVAFLGLLTLKLARREASPNDGA